MVRSAGRSLFPQVFDEEYRPDLIRKAVISLQSSRRQPHGTHPYAGIRSSAVGWGSGRGMSHVPRIKNGSRAAKVPQAKGGREAHPPKYRKDPFEIYQQEGKGEGFPLCNCRKHRAKTSSRDGGTVLKGKSRLFWKTGSKN